MKIKATSSSFSKHPQLRAALLESFSDAEFRKFFSGTAVKRLGSTRFLRNVIYAMGNSGNRGYIGLLERFLGYSVDYVSEAAAWSISELKKNV